MRRSVAGAWVVLAALGCNRSSGDAAALPVAASDAGAVGMGTAVSDAALPTTSAADAAGSPSAIDDAYSTALPVRGKSIGHTSIVFKLGLAGGFDAAYKPRSRVGGERFRGEIAAYRSARAWGLDNVPPVIVRSFSAAALRGALDEKGAGVFANEVVAESDAAVRGALIPWIPKLGFLPLETTSERARWGSWLDDLSAPLPTACDANLAGQISTMILFDTMSGNWDRWSGGNIGVDVAAPKNACDRVLFIDNDGAFFDPVPAAPLAAQLALVKKMNRFSQSFVARLRTATEADLTSAIGNEAPGRPLLSKHVLDGFFARRKAVLAAIEAKITANGEASTLSLP